MVVGNWVCDAVAGAGTAGIGSSTGHSGWNFHCECSDARTRTVVCLSRNLPELGQSLCCHTEIANQVFFV